LTNSVARDHNVEVGLGSPVNIVRHGRGDLFFTTTVSSTSTSSKRAGLSPVPGSREAPAVDGGAVDGSSVSVSAIVTRISSSKTWYGDRVKKLVRKEGM